MSRGFDAVYTETGEGLIRAGGAARLSLLLQVASGGLWVAESLQSRTFVQRIFDEDGASLLEIDGEVETDDGEDSVVFLITSTQTAALLSEGQTIRDLTHVVVEIDGDDEFDVLSRSSFRVRA